MGLGESFTWYYLGVGRPDTDNKPTITFAIPPCELWHDWWSYCNREAYGGESFEECCKVYDTIVMTINDCYAWPTVDDKMIHSRLPSPFLDTDRLPVGRHNWLSSPRRSVRYSAEEIQLGSLDVYDHGSLILHARDTFLDNALCFRGRDLFWGTRVKTSSRIFRKRISFTQNNFRTVASLTNPMHRKSSTFFQQIPVSAKRSTIDSSASTIVQYVLWLTSSMVKVND